MRKILISLLFISASASAAAAQSAGDYNKVEFYGGYSHARVAPNSATQTVSEGGQSFTFEPCAPDGAAILGSNFQRHVCERRGFNGFDASVTYNPIFARDRNVPGNAEFTLHVAGRRSDTDTFGFGIAFH
jgi:hypothetical protein